jgi:hypothetical protein
LFCMPHKGRPMAKQKNRNRLMLPFDIVDSRSF